MGCKVEATVNCVSASSYTRASTSMLALVLTEQREQVLKGICSENPKAADKSTSWTENA